MAEATKKPTKAKVAEPKLKALKSGSHSIGDKTYSFEAGDIIKPNKGDFDSLASLKHIEIC